MSDASNSNTPGSGGGRRKLGAVEWIVLLGLLGFAVYGMFFGSGPC